VNDTRSVSQTLVRTASSLTLAGILVAVVLPRLVGTTAHDVASSFARVSMGELVALAALWSLGLLAHTFVLTGALPGLSHRRALTLNLTGSAVSNVLPFGGAAGISLNYAMLRSWSVSTAGFAAYTLVTNVWVVLLKLALPGIAFAVLLMTGVRIGHTLVVAAALAVAALTVGVAGLVVALVSRRLAALGADLLAGAVAALAGLFGRHPDREAFAASVLSCRDTVADVVHRNGWQLSAGMVGYALLQALLLGACLMAVGAGLSAAQVLAAFSVDRLLTLAVVTPGGLGVTETGTAATLVAFGADPALAAAGVLLYRGFTFALEIPVGGTWLGGWLVMRRLRRTAIDEV
jgi:uncharacterized membrane protein YbhN (UPF0104 family)